MDLSRRGDERLLEMIDMTQPGNACALRDPLSDFAFRLFAVAGMARLGRVTMRDRVQVGMIGMDVARACDDLCQIAVTFLRELDVDQVSAGLRAQSDLMIWLEKNVTDDPDPAAQRPSVSLFDWMARKDCGHE